MDTPEDLEAKLRAAIDAADIAELERVAALMDAEDDQRRARLAAPDALAQAAHWYASVGVAVFPLRPRDKVPLLRSVHPEGDEQRGKCKGECGRLGHGLYDATTDITQIDAWWTASPDSNIGARTGITFDVFDIDGQPGIDSMVKILEQAELDGHESPFEECIGRSATSRDGGTHIFMPPSGRGNAAKIWPGIDHRGAGGYVVLPPSIGANGRRYTWLQPLEVTRG